MGTVKKKKKKNKIYLEQNSESRKRLIHVWKISIDKNSTFIYWEKITFTINSVGASKQTYPILQVNN